MDTNIVVDPSKPNTNNFGCTPGEIAYFQTITEAIVFFNTLKTVSTDPNNLIYQKLNIQLVDGDHTFENVQTLVQFNMTISPLTSSSQNVNIILTGDTDTNDMINIEPILPASTSKADMHN